MAIVARDDDPEAPIRWHAGNRIEEIAGPRPDRLGHRLRLPDARTVVGLEIAQDRLIEEREPAAVVMAPPPGTPAARKKGWLKACRASSVTSFSGAMGQPTSAASSGVIGSPT